MMKRITILGVVLILLATTLMAAPRSQQQAMAEATSFLLKKGNNAAKDIKMSFRSPRKQSAKGDAYYVFNLDNDNGFVIISGDDRIPAVIGYSDSGHFETGNMPAHIKAWMDSYDQQLQLLDEGKAAARSKVPAKATETAKHSIAPLLTCNWNQDAPYYNQCPKQSSQSTYTGCVATAMAQVLYYHRNRSVKATLKKIPGYTTISNRIKLNDIPAGSAIDWDNMVDNYNSNATTAQKNAVASLMKYCGYAVKMDYTTQGSGAYSEMIPMALINYFGYDKNTTHIFRSDYTAGEWDDIIYNEIAENRPVLYGGASMGGGHQFVLDGYDTDGLFHVNWGWGGSSNGYFLISVLNPEDNSGIGASSTTDGYSISQTAVIGAEPADVPADYEYFNYMAAELVSINGATVSYGVYNEACQDGTFIIALLAENQETGDQTVITGVRSGNMEMGYGVDVDFELTETILSNVNLPAGTYTLRLISQMDGDDNVYFVRMGDNDLVVLNYDGSNISLSIDYWGKDLKANNITAGATIRTTSGYSYTYSVPVSFDLTNNAGYEYCGTIYLFASTSSSKGDYAALTSVVVKAGKTVNMSLSPTVSQRGGTYNIWISTDQNGNNVIGSGRVTVAAYSSGSSSSPLSFGGINVNNISSGTNVYGNILDGNITVSNSSSAEFSGGLSVKLYPSNSIYPLETQTTICNIEGNGTATVPFHFEGLDYSTTYYLGLVDAGTSEQIGGTREYYRCLPAVIAYKAGGIEATPPTESYTVPDDALAVDFSATSAVKNITPNSHPNTLYYFAKASDVPATVTKNVIVGNTAESIELSDNGSMAVPVAFTAENISYSRTMDITTNGSGGWQTMVLPFDVDEVVIANDNKTVDWFHSSTDEDKDFWVKTFTQASDDGTVYFDFAKTIDAYIPYIIAVPGNRWGEEWNMMGKTLMFKATDTRVYANTKSVLATSLFNFEGTMQQLSRSNIYCLNEQGNNFSLTDNADIPAFRACFVGKDLGNKAPKVLRIAQQDDTVTLIGNLQTDANDSSSAVYDMQGRRLSTPFEALPKGIYIIGNKKIVKK